ncbi:unnamed protein product [Phytophthora fragariaefolia]|uniref:Unnamed protein product n=1 Tax=Phytophthora fragariaefolia TaxID=1490495 RepID=A0A9W6XFD3_9STRA|nr:unnamed protein product [Phytophthora fragariaefolia]
MASRAEADSCPNSLTNGDYFFDPMYDVVHMDEKWFDVKKIGQKVYLLTGKDGKDAEEPTVQYVHSKRYITKVMFLCAVARPRGDWGGKIGLWPVVETYTTQRASVNRPAGVEELRPVSITRKISRRMLIDNLIPAIKARWPQNQKHMHIRLQQDYARPHVDEDDPLVLSARCSDGWTIMLSNQPAQIPDLNSLDLGFFSSNQSLRCRTVPRTTEELIAEAQRLRPHAQGPIARCRDAIPCDVQTVSDAHLGIATLSALPALQAIPTLPTPQLATASQCSGTHRPTAGQQHTTSPMPSVSATPPSDSCASWTSAYLITSENNEAKRCHFFSQGALFLLRR